MTVERLDQVYPLTQAANVIVAVHRGLGHVLSVVVHQTDGITWNQGVLGVIKTRLALWTLWTLWTLWAFRTGYC